MTIFHRPESIAVPLVLGAAMILSASQAVGTLKLGGPFTAAEPKIVSSSQLTSTSPERQASGSVRRPSCTPGFRCSTGERSIPKKTSPKAVRMAMLLGMSGQLKRF